jgi:predicted component of viral defense system (DUF524 family)
MTNELIIPLEFTKAASLILFAENTDKKTLFEIERLEAIENGESCYQLVEGCAYEYEFTDTALTFEKLSGVISVSKRRSFCGRITPNIYVGTLYLNVYKNGCQIGKVPLEVRSVKSSYREDYRFMLNSIAEKCTDLILQANSPVTQNLMDNHNLDSQSLYQKYSFIQSMLTTPEFGDAIHQIVNNPVTAWEENYKTSDVRYIKRIDNKTIRQFSRGGNTRVAVPVEHYLFRNGISSLPAKTVVTNKNDTVDTHENRFIKHALQVFLLFITDIFAKLKSDSRESHECQQLIKRIEDWLSHPIFNNVSDPTMLRLNSPVLQRKSGYREVLNVWIRFELAAKLVWNGGNNVYQAGKRDVAVLYEYWLFFILLDLVRDIFMIEPKSISALIATTTNSLGLQLKQGEHVAIDGVCREYPRSLRVRFSYNRTFGQSSNYPDSGSWSEKMRPDYTLSLWPADLEEERAELTEEILHIHFDAKYKVENMFALLESGPDGLQTEKDEQNKGNYKRADLLKMHAYKDAIRRTVGAYILYPGEKSIARQGFHELLPGLGSFAIRPSNNNNGVDNLRLFITDVVQHVINRASQRERLSAHVAEIHRYKHPFSLIVNLPEYIDDIKLIPDETFVLVGYYKNQKHLEWIKQNSLYNIRADGRRGSIPITYKELNAKFLLLHTKESHNAELWLIKNNYPTILSQAQMINKNYPTPNGASYLVFEIKKQEIEELHRQKWNVKNLRKYKELIKQPDGFNGTAPFTITLTELLTS